MELTYGTSPALKASIEAQETGGTIPVSDPGWVPAKFSMVLAERLANDIRYHYAAFEYLMWCGKLPGSDRTKRLRKKRRSKVMQWRYGK